MKDNAMVSGRSCPRDRH